MSRTQNTDGTSRCPSLKVKTLNDSPKNIQRQSSGNGISMNGFFLLPHEISSEPIDTLEVSIGVLAYQLSQLRCCLFSSYY